MVTEKVPTNETETFAYNTLLEGERYKILALWQKAKRGELTGKKIILRTPFHENPVIHCVLYRVLMINGVREIDIQDTKRDSWKFPANLQYVDMCRHFHWTI